ncbi:hypothetical protein T310_8776, partial [Rasamsonia emersonii CBS 393.64]
KEEREREREGGISQDLFWCSSQVRRSTFVATATGFIVPSLSLSVTTAALFHSKNRFSTLSGVSHVISMNLRFLPRGFLRPVVFEGSPFSLESIARMSRGSVTTSVSFEKSNMTSETGVFPVARP